MFKPTVIAAVLLAACGAASARDNVDHVTCESKDYRRETCRVDTRGNDVRLVKQTSNTRCVQGRNWGWSQGRVWVDRGCAGEFESRTDRPGRPGGRPGDRDDRGGMRADRRQTDACADAIAREPGIRRGDVSLVRSAPMSGQDGMGNMQIEMRTPKGRYVCTVTPNGQVQDISR